MLCRWSDWSVTELFSPAGRVIICHTELPTELYEHTMLPTPGSRSSTLPALPAFHRLRPVLYKPLWPVLEDWPSTKKFVWSLIPRLSTWRCLLLSSGAGRRNRLIAGMRRRQLLINICCLCPSCSKPVAHRCSYLSTGQTDGRTDAVPLHGRSPP